MLKRTQKMVLEVFRRAQAETHVLFKVNMACCLLGHSTLTLSSLHMHAGLSFNELGDCRRSISVDSKWGFSLYTSCILSKTCFVKPLSHFTNPGCINSQNMFAWALVFASRFVLTAHPLFCEGSHCGTSAFISSPKSTRTDGLSTMTCLHFSLAL